MTSCATCRFFQPAIPPSEDGPGDPPFCNWAPFEDYPPWVGDVVGRWLSDDDLAAAEDRCPAWRPQDRAA